MKLIFKIAPAMVVALTAIGQSAFAADEVLPPANVVARFYATYVGLMKSMPDPLTEGGSFMRDHVSKALITEVKAAQSGTDYFTGTPKGMDLSLDAYKVNEISATQSAATEAVIFKHGDNAFRKLTVSMIKEGKAWKIRKVESAGE